MKQANLLIELDSFRWDDTDLDRSIGITDFMLAYNKARSGNDISDRIFNAPDFWQLDIDGVNFIEIIANPQKAASFFEWLQPDHRTFIVRQMMNYGTTPNESSTLEEMEREEGFIDENNGLLKIEPSEQEKCVFDVNSWYRLHINYIKRFPDFINWVNNDVLPYCEYSNLHIFELIKQHSQELRNEDAMLEFFQHELIRTFRSNAGDLIELATEIASRNGYSQSQQLSSQEARLRNSRRLIFEISKNNQQQYLSLDFENGQFEVCDVNGRHLGVLNFSGDITGEADTTGNHDIWTISR